MNGQYYGNSKYHLVNVILFILEGHIGRSQPCNNVVDYKLGDIVLKAANNVSDLGVVYLLIANLTFVNMLPTLLEKHMLELTQFFAVLSRDIGCLILTNLKFTFDLY